MSRPDQSPHYDTSYQHTINPLTLESATSYPSPVQSEVDYHCSPSTLGMYNCPSHYNPAALGTFTVAPSQFTVPDTPPNLFASSLEPNNPWSQHSTMLDASMTLSSSMPYPMMPAYSNQTWRSPSTSSYRDSYTPSLPTSRDNSVFSDMGSEYAVGAGIPRVEARRSPMENELTMHSRTELSSSTSTASTHTVTLQNRADSPQATHASQFQAFQSLQPRPASPLPTSTQAAPSRRVRASQPSGKTQITCEHCGKTFGRSFNLCQHKAKKHNPTYVRPFICEVKACGFAFDRKMDLTRHVESVHLKLLKHVCICSKGFPRKDTLKRHRSTACPQRAQVTRRQKGVHKQAKPERRYTRIVKEEYGYSGDFFRG